MSPSGVGVLPPYRYERPVANYFGILRKAGERLVCHMCGKDWVFLGTHVWLTHGMTADQYRAEFGLNRTTSLVAQSLKRRLSEHSKSLVRSGRSGLVPKDAEGMRALGRMAHKPARMQRKIEQSIQRGGASPCPKGHERSRQTSGALVCPVCVAMRPPRPKRLVFLGPPRPRSLVGDLCSKGHPWDGFTVTNWNGRPRRACRQCNRDQVRRWRKQNPEKARAMKQRAARRAAA